MLFNSFEFLLFFPIVCVIYWLLPARFRNTFLLIASYYFYLSWKAIYGLLILFVSLVTWGGTRFFVVNKQEKNKKIILISSILIVLGVLFVFKYANFLIDTVNDFFLLFHVRMQIPELYLLLPVGISFFTFQTIGYVIDVYRGDVKVEKDFFTYALFVSFFPQLVAGPIERARNLLPQFHKVHYFSTSQAVEGCRLILWGYFMKVIISDRLAVYVDSVYNNVSHHTGASLILASVLFAFQIYCDFGGYSNIAIGCAKIMGFNLMMNFKRPYLAVSVADFWRRWHISLSTWFKDYVYIPLGGNRCSKNRHYWNLLVTFIVSGIWHGANWTFLIWGGLNGLFQIVGKVFTPVRNKVLQNLRISECSLLVKIYDVVVTFIFITFAWIFFRANNVNDAFLVVKRIFTVPGKLFTNNIDSLVYGIGFVVLLVISDVLQEKNEGRHVLLDNKSLFVRYISYIGLTIIIIAFGVFDSAQFIYFQF